jgi:hypothetical protein
MRIQQAEFALTVTMDPKKSNYIEQQTFITTAENITVVAKNLQQPVARRPQRPLQVNSSPRNTKGNNITTSATCVNISKTPAVWHRYCCSDTTEKE